MNGIAYIAHKEGDELTHYGVRGMKWGVRREIGQRARTYAKLQPLYNKVSKKLEKTELKIDTKLARGSNPNQKLLSRQARQLEAFSRIKARRNKAGEGLSDRDKLQGKISVYAKKILKPTAIVGGVLALTTAGMVAANVAYKKNPVFQVAVDGFLSKKLPFVSR